MGSLPELGAQPQGRFPRWGEDLSIWLLAFILRVGYILELRNSIVFSILMGDAKSYDAWARQIVGGNLLGAGIFYQVPLYPYFLAGIYAIFGTSLIWVRLIQAVIGACACVFLARSGRIFFSGRVGTIAGLMLAIYPVAIFYDGSVQKSCLDLFFLTFLLLALGKTTVSPGRKWWLLAGITVASLTLTRQNTLALVPVLAIFAWIQSRKERPGVLWSRLGLLSAGMAALLIPVGLRNLAVGGEFGISSSFGPNLYIGNSPYSNGTYFPLRAGHGSYEYEESDARDLAEGALGRKLTSSEVSHYWAQRAVAFMRAQPGAWARLMVRKALLALNRVEIVDSENQASYGRWSLIMRLLTFIFHFGVLAPLAAFGLIAGWRRGSRLWLLAAIGGVYLLSIVVFFIFSRSRFPIVPVLVLFAAAGVVGAPDLLRRRRFTRLVIALFALVGVAFLSHWPLLAAEERAAQALMDNNIGAYLLDAPGREQEALSYISEAIRLVPTSDAPYVNRGEALRRLGRLDEAAASWKHALELSPNSSDVHAQLGAVLADLGRTDEALVSYRKAVSLDPRNGELHNRLGALLAPRQPDEALPHFVAAVALMPRNASAHHNLGNLLLHKGEPEDGIRHLEESIRLDPQFALPRVKLANALLQKGRTGESLEQARTALRLEMNNPFLMAELTWFILRHPEREARDVEAAVILAREAARLSGGKAPLVLDAFAAAIAQQRTPTPSRSGGAMR